MLSLLSLAGGFILRYLPSIGGWVSKIFEGWWDDRREEKRAMWQAQMQKEEKILDAQLQEALTKMMVEMKEISNLVKDRDSARDFQTKLVSNMDHTLGRGQTLGVAGWLKSFGWWGVLAIEGWSALMQPLIATVILTMWAAWKISLLYQAATATGSVAVGVQAMWGVEDWFLMEAVFGYYLAGRVIKFQNASNVNTAIRG